ncbi:MAG: hypothetical protein WC404_06220 [Candidatus Omnitrophota bacterium]|jgi:hypothetical protein
MDNFTLNHLDKWLEGARYENEREKIKITILNFIDAYPDLLINHSWPEIERLALR